MGFGVRLTAQKGTAGTLPSRARFHFHLPDKSAYRTSDFPDSVCPSKCPVCLKTLQNFRYAVWYILQT